VVDAPLGGDDRLGRVLRGGPGVEAGEPGLAGGAVHEVGEVTVVVAAGLGVEVRVHADPVDDVVARVQVEPPRRVVPLLVVHVRDGRDGVFHALGTQAQDRVPVHRGEVLRG